MGKTLVRAMTAINERKSGGARGSPGAAAVAEETVENPTQPPTTARGPHGTGLRELCRTLFHHCVGAIGYISPSSGVTDDEAGAVSFLSRASNELSLAGRRPSRYVCMYITSDCSGSIQRWHAGQVTPNTRTGPENISHVPTSECGVPPMLMRDPANVKNPACRSVPAL